MNLLQTTTPDTMAYMLGGFGVIFGAIFIHVISMYSRAGRMKKDLALLEELEAEEE